MAWESGAYIELGQTVNMEQKTETIREFLRRSLGRKGDKIEWDGKWVKEGNKHRNKRKSRHARTVQKCPSPQCVQDLLIVP